MGRNVATGAVAAMVLATAAVTFVMAHVHDPTRHHSHAHHHGHQAIRALQPVRGSNGDSVEFELQEYPALAVINANAAYAEGASIIAGELFYAEYASHKVKAYHSDTKVHRVVWDPTALPAAQRASLFGTADGAQCGTSAVMKWPEHGLLVTCYDADAVVLLDDAAPHAVRHVWRGVIGPAATSGGSTTTEPWDGPNDLAVDDHHSHNHHAHHAHPTGGGGGVFVSTSGPRFDATAPPTGCVYHIGADWSVRRMTDCDIAYANGMVLLPTHMDAANEVLLVAEHLRNRILAFDVDVNDGHRLSNRRVWSDLSVTAPLDDPWALEPADSPNRPHLPTHADWNRTAPTAAEGGWRNLRLGPNGMKAHINPETFSGWVYVAQHGGGRVLKLDARSGVRLGEIMLPHRWASNLALDPVHGMVYICTVLRYTEPDYPGAIFAARDRHLKPFADAHDTHVPQPRNSVEHHYEKPKPVEQPRKPPIHIEL